MTSRSMKQGLMVLTVMVTVAVWPGHARAADQDWSFTLAPYFWMSGLKGDIAPFASLPPTSVDASFSDVFDTLRMAFLLAGEARRGKFALVGDIQYYDLEANAETPLPLYSGVALGTKVNLYSGGIAYRMAGDKEAFVDAVAHLRYSSIEVSVDFYEGLLPSLSGQSSENWLDPMLGIKARQKIGDRWSVMGWAFVALGGDSDSTWDAMAAASYQMTDRWQAQLGYRYMVIDFAKDGFVYDMTHSGPMLGVSYAF